ncbi:MAG TPA: pantoate--beta-alanine ligase [Gammaproteobacteria bacterium]
MLSIESPQSLREHLHTWRRQELSIAFVPTMGNLHQGHLQLVEAAKPRAEKVVASIFVNPLQFVPGTDFETYPRTLQQDLEQLQSRHVDLVFCPPVAAIYPEGMNVSAKVVVPGLSDILCGEFRPGHFVGVATVVAKLFNLVQPDVAVFGEKDYQQLLVIRRMVDDLCFPVDIIGVETVREADGLAMSSRNQYLSDAERKTAALLSATLMDLVTKVTKRIGHPDAAPQHFHDVEQQALRELQTQGFRPEYVKVCFADNLADADIASGSTRELRVLAAAWLGKARLIDNLPVNNLPIITR